MFRNLHDVALHDDDSSDWSTGKLSSRFIPKVVLSLVSGFYGDIQSLSVALTGYGVGPAV